MNVHSDLCQAEEKNEFARANNIPLSGWLNKRQRLLIIKVAQLLGLNAYEKGFIFKNIYFEGRNYPAKKFLFNTMRLLSFSKLKVPDNISTFADFREFENKCYFNLSSNIRDKVRDKNNYQFQDSDFQNNYFLKELRKGTAYSVSYARDRAYDDYYRSGNQRSHKTQQQDD